MIGGSSRHPCSVTGRSVSSMLWFAVWTIEYGPKFVPSPTTRPLKPLTKQPTLKPTPSPSSIRSPLSQTIESR